MIDQLSLEKRIDALFAGFDQQPMPGYAVGVMQQGQVLLSRGYGMASLELDVPIRADTVFRVASVSKQFTVSAILMLAADGRLSLNDDVRRHIPELPELPATVTLEHLMRNTSGLPDFLEMLRLGGVGLDMHIGRERMLELVCMNRHLNFPPGSRFLYCNTNFLLLGVIVERISGQTLAAFLKQRIFQPLGMSRTTMTRETDSLVPGLASAYLQGPDGQYRRASHAFEQGGEGGMVSTVEDLMIWSRHFDNPLLKPADLSDQLTAATALNNGSASPYSRGIERGQLATMATIGHGGLWPGFKTEFLRIPQQGLTVVVIANCGSLEPYRMAREVASAVLGIAAPVTSANATELDALSGEWFSAGDAVHGEPALFKLSVKDGKLIASQWGVDFQLVRGADGSWTPLRGAYEFRMSAPSSDSLQVEVGAGRSLQFARLAVRPSLPDGLSGDYVCAHNSAHWRIEPAPDATGGLQVSISGPLLSDGGAWTMQGVQGDVVEALGQSYWLKSSQLLRFERDAAGAVTHLLVDTGRVKNLRFDRNGAA